MEPTPAVQILDGRPSHGDAYRQPEVFQEWSVHPAPRFGNDVPGRQHLAQLAEQGAFTPPARSGLAVAGTPASQGAIGHAAHAQAQVGQHVGKPVVVDLLPVDGVPGGLSSLVVGEDAAMLLPLLAPEVHRSIPVQEELGERPMVQRVAALCQRGRTVGGQQLAHGPQPFEGLATADLGE